ncbi:Oligopeptide transport system permease protein OppB (TC 3.A.1.5.1) [Microbacterium esteraromaticum]|uniref:Oligopeptide transport system permease protein OppB (TC 3.A.1.5.1) n=1 Tax=Microbacterium esteraromaticum TaxID=57043 RepID=A0A1R4INU9_9MICO|nr:ABC transporter ATP-binding protein [Microbacterium esteraromaticum]SJN21315.1 Oligopeptide transport system permease protein OppB (TC 3.A.1.5.1) [Microbacterium esteraromaticum]
MSANILEVEDLHTSFFTRKGEVKAVRGVSFDLAEGETLGIVGESGSGKSVTAMSIMQLLAHSGRIVGGSVRFDGDDLATLSDRQLRAVRGARIAMIFQDPMSSLNPLIPVGKQVRELLDTHTDMTKAQAKERVLELFRMVRISEPERRYSSYPHEFSGGMRQRVMIAMALACEPDVLIADEPTTALDVTIQDQILRILRRLQAELGMSVIFITHDLGVVAEVCSRVAVMYGGQIIEEGTLEEIYTKTAHPYTLGLLNSRPRIDGDRDERLESIPGTPPDLMFPPRGCAFADRCAFARQICQTTPPEVTQLSETHTSRCHLLSPDAPIENNPFTELRTAHA